MTKSNSPLVGLGRQWVPIFADPDRDYQYLTECRSFRRTRTGLRLNALTNEGEPVTVTLTFVTPEVLRVRVGFAKVDRETFEQCGALVKAITYHDLEVVEADSGWRARYYVDV